MHIGQKLRHSYNFRHEAWLVDRFEDQQLQVRPLERFETSVAPAAQAVSLQHLDCTSPLAEICMCS